MNSKSTLLWFLLAVVLATAIWISGHYFQPGVIGEKPLFAGLRTARVTGIQVIPGGAREISVTRTHQSWRLEKPIIYPAQAAAIEGLLGTLEKLTPILSLSAGELSGRNNTDAELGFSNPQFTLDLTAGDQKWHLLVGNRTAPGDGVYVRVVGAAGAYVTDPAWLNFLPHEANDWRDTSLVNVPETLDWLVVTNGTQAIELRRDHTNRLWRLLRPLPARANNLRIVAALQQLRAANVSRFTNDDPKADLTSYGLAPANLDIWLGSDTNLLTAVHAGKDVPGMAGELFARREGWNNVVTTPKEPLAAWRGTVNDFRDPNLLELTAPVMEIEVRGEKNYTLQQGGSNTWTVAGEKFPVDQDQVKRFIQTLASLQIADFVRDVVPTSILQNYGLLNPSHEITLRSVVGDTNHVMAQLLFGATTNNQMYVKRGDEEFVYALAPGHLSVLDLSGDNFRARRIWSFSETNVAQVTLRQYGKTRQMIRTGTNEWSLAAGSQGIINPPAIEETIHQLGELTAFAWWGRKFNEAEEVGLTTNSLSVTIELKSGEKYSLAFGKEVRISSQNASTAMAVVTLEGERWAFVFPPALCQSVAEYLTIPEDTKPPTGGP
jgi:hypothetical protein